MAKEETGIQNAVRIALSRRGALNWRQHVGLSYGADGSPRTHGFPGWSDLGGIYRGIGLQLEVKTPTGRLSTEQKDWGRAVNKAGGLFSVVRNPEEALALLDHIDRSLGDNWFLELPRLKV